MNELKSIKRLESKIRIFLIKQKIKENFNNLKRYNKYMNFKPVGQRITKFDPYGEENWDE